MERIDLHNEFLNALYGKEPKRINLINKISDILLIEKESAYRRLTGKVNFSVYEMGKVAQAFDISIDQMLHRDIEYQWLPFTLESPLKYDSMEPLCDIINSHIGQLINTSEEPIEIGGVYNSMPVEFFIYHPILMKFMFFKWGHYFVGTDEFDNFSEWEIPQRLTGLKEKLEQLRFSKSLYIWDNTLIWALANEIDKFHKMHIISTEDKQALKNEMKAQLTKLEQYIKGIYQTEIFTSPKTEFYVCMVNVGFTSIYQASGQKCSVLFQTGFSNALIHDCRESYDRLKKWIKSIRHNSVLISGSGSIERRLFFEKQHKIIDVILE